MLTTTRPGQWSDTAGSFGPTALKVQEATWSARGSMAKAHRGHRVLGVLLVVIVAAVVVAAIEGSRVKSRRQEPPRPQLPLPRRPRRPQRQLRQRPPQFKPVRSVPRSTSSPELQITSTRMKTKFHTSAAYRCIGSGPRREPVQSAKPWLPICRSGLRHYRPG